MTTQDPFSISCNRCNRPFSIEQYVPIQSRTCEHSICAVCIDSVKQEKRSNAATSSGNNDEFIPCHECHAENAFPLKDYKAMANALACGALVVMEKMQKQLQKYQGEKKAHPKSLNETLAKESTSISPSTSYEDNAATEDNARAPSGREEEFASPLASNQRSMGTTSASLSEGDTTLAKSSGNSSTNASPSSRATLESSPNHQYNQQSSDRTRPVLVSPSPGERKLVWVKFDKGSHLAYLLSVSGDMAKIRWESNKFEEEVPVDVLEEVETGGSPSERPKRTRNGNNKAINSKRKSGSGVTNHKRRNSFQSPQKGRKSKMMRAN